MELQEYWRVVVKRWRVILAALLATVAVAVTITLVTPPRYQSTSRLFVSAKTGGTISDLAAGSTFSQRQVKTYADVITTPTVLGPVVEELGLPVSAAELATQVTASVPVDTVLINVSVTDTDPVSAVRIAETVSRQATSAIGDLETVSDAEGSPVKVTVVTSAGEAIQVAPRPARNVGLGVVLGVLLGLGLALLRDRFDTSVKTEQDAAELTDVSIIGRIPFDPSADMVPLIMQGDPRSARAEAFRAVRMNLQFIDVSDPPRAFVVTSSLRGEGKSTTSANLALAIAANGSTVCIVEGDLRRPGMSAYLGLETGVGLTSVLIGEAGLDDVIQPFADTDVTVLGAGPIPPNPSELLGSAKMRQVLDDLEARFDYVVIDTPPLLPVTDAAVVSTLVDGALLVVGAGVIRREHLTRSLSVLETVGARTFGLVVNRLPAQASATHSYYGGDGTDGVYGSPGEDADPKRIAWRRRLGRPRRASAAAAAQGRAAGKAARRVVPTEAKAGDPDARSRAQTRADRHGRRRRSHRA